MMTVSYGRRFLREHTRSNLACRRSAAWQNSNVFSIWQNCPGAIIRTVELCGTQVPDKRSRLAKIPLVASRQDTITIAHAFRHRKKPWLAILRLSDSTARHDERDRRDPHNTCPGASPRTVLTGVNMSTSFFPEVIPEIDVNPEHKMQKLYTWALLLIVVRHVGTSTARHARHVVHVVSWRDATSGIWAIR